MNTELKPSPSKSLVQDFGQTGLDDANGNDISLPGPAVMFSPLPVSELDAAAVKLQKVYRSYQTRKNLADCAAVVDELWEFNVYINYSYHVAAYGLFMQVLISIYKKPTIEQLHIVTQREALDFADLKRSSVSFFEDEETETAASRWARLSTRVARVVKVLSKDGEPQKLDLHNWLEQLTRTIEMATIYVFIMTFGSKVKVFNLSYTGWMLETEKK